ncbi:hypothetical protein V1387_12810 [Allomuricauda taeanensis]|uniref:hypothetical protein n=1 Tax=Flagellimonas taeanensis TaxID=1005926 RepID=UPI002E7C30C4|nr:hypothetical protein [Allomuricauda taeanensis]MEE1963571.1 hypothetical protein [Allomuricauda taeanensis]
MDTRELRAGDIVNLNGGIDCIVNKIDSNEIEFEILNYRNGWREPNGKFLKFPIGSIPPFKFLPPQEKPKWDM